MSVCASSIGKFSLFIAFYGNIYKEIISTFWQLFCIFSIVSKCQLLYCSYKLECTDIIFDGMPAYYMSQVTYCFARRIFSQWDS